MDGLLPVGAVRAKVPPGGDQPHCSGTLITMMQKNGLQMSTVRHKGIHNTDHLEKIAALGGDKMGLRLETTMGYQFLLERKRVENIIITIAVI